MLKHSCYKYISLNQIGLLLNYLVIASVIPQPTLLAQSEGDIKAIELQQTPEMEMIANMDMNHILSLSFHKTQITRSSLESLAPQRHQSVNLRFELTQLPTKPLTLVEGTEGVIVYPSQEGQLSLVYQDGRVHLRHKVGKASEGYSIVYPKIQGNYLIQLKGSDGYLYEYILRR